MMMSGSVALLALTVLVGWALDVSWLTTFGGPVPMVPTSAICVVVVAGIECLRIFGCRDHRLCWFDAFAAGLTAAVAFVALMTLVDGPSLGRWLWPVPRSTYQPDARMADSTALCLLILCVGQWLPKAGRLLTAGALFMIVGLMWFLPSSLGANWMAWPTMIALIGLSAANRLRGSRA